MQSTTENSYSAVNLYLLECVINGVKSLLTSVRAKSVSIQVVMQQKSLLHSQNSSLIFTVHTEDANTNQDHIPGFTFLPQLISTR